MHGPRTRTISQWQPCTLRRKYPTCLPICDCWSKKGQSATLDDWLGSSAGGAASSPRDMPPLLLPRVPLPPLMLPSGDAGAVRPAKKRKGLTAADRDVEAVMLRMLKQVWVSSDLHHERTVCSHGLGLPPMPWCMCMCQHTGQYSCAPAAQLLPYIH